ncbi:ABC transporter substrate-binding protein [Thermomicrobium sp. CFH 73360]|uniref:ABC transporter substrate-binding protein n=1 Tax=Thermomicrobium sp. CFH 73360 TaxID=2951987 RepID=UPI00207749AA|nr:ABC transporter substrate-binding protein [Thermomicrobium sp. CFH 73360]MCM8746270.1 ABC transporter substrate-binding protein [Thermomicrobium sp. CFH 73360]
MQRMDRRAFLKRAFGALGVSALMAACAGGQATPTPTAAPAATPTPAAATPTTAPATPTPAAAVTPTAAATVTREPIRIGVLLTLSGPASPNGEANLRGIQLAFKEAGNAIAGRPFELFIEDSAGQPDQALSKARQLLEQRRVHLLMGITLSSEAAALRDYLHQSEMPTIVTNAALQALTRDPKMRSPFIFRVSYANGQYDSPVADYAYQKLGYKRMLGFAADYAAGKEELAAFKARFTKAGGTWVDEFYSPMGTQDFGPFLQRIQQQAGNIDAVFQFHGLSSDAIRLVVQYEEFGLKDQIPLIASGATTDDSILSEMGDAAVGLVSGTVYTSSIDLPGNKKFVDTFRGEYNRKPGQVDYLGYLGGLVVRQAIEAVRGSVEDKQAFIQAVKSVRVAAPAGEFRFYPESQGPVHTVYICRVAKAADGSYYNEILEKIPNVDDMTFM